MGGMRERSESTFATLIIAGVIMLGLGVLCLMFGYGSGTSEILRGRMASSGSAGMALLGFILGAGGLGTLTFAMVSVAAIGSLEKRGVRKVDRNAKILARYAANRQGETLVLEWQFDDPHTKFFARVQLSDGSRVEFQCVREVFDQCGEGMTGEAQYQGRWLGYFRPYIGVQPPA